MPLTATTVTELLEGRTTRLSEDGIRTGERRWHVTLDVSAATSTDFESVEADVESALPVALYDAHPAFPAAIARGVVTTRVSRDTWLSVVSYSSAPFQARGDGSGGSATGSGGGPASPGSSGSADAEADQRPPEIRIRRQERTEALEEDVITGDPVRNTAGDPFDPPVEVTRGRPVYEITIYRTPSGLSWSSRVALWDKVNDATVMLLGKSHAAKTLKVLDISLDAVWDKGTGGALAFFWKISIALEYKATGWRFKVLNAGRREKVGSPTPKLIPIVDPSTGQPVTEAVPLTSGGARLAAGGTYHYLDVDGYATADFTTLFA